MEAARDSTSVCSADTVWSVEEDAPMANKLENNFSLISVVPAFFPFDSGEFGAAVFLFYY